MLSKCVSAWYTGVINTDNIRKMMCLNGWCYIGGG